VATRAIVVLTLGLWAQEGYEDATNPRWLPPALGNLLDCATVTLSVGIILWLTHTHFARRHADIRRRDAEIDQLTRFAGATALSSEEQLPLRVAAREGKRA
jgi:hypothetical protein